MVDIDEDSFCCILGHIHDVKTLYAILFALPRSHPLFPVALARLWELPVYLDSYDHRAAAASQTILDFLLDPNGGSESYPLAESIRHLDVSIEHADLETKHQRRGQPDPMARTAPADVVALQERLPDLFRRVVNLQSLDYHCRPGVDMKRRHVEPLQHLERLRRVALDCALRDRGIDIPASAGTGDLSAQYDAEVWEMESFLAAVGPSIASLDLRYVNQTMFTALANHAGVLASYRALRHLKIDITEGVWDWNGAGSPAMGASPEFAFPFLGFPSVDRFELVVCDQTLYKPQTGPMNLVHSSLLTELSLDVRNSIGWIAMKTIKLFEALSPLDFPALSHLEIKDSTRNTQRQFWDNTDEPNRWNRLGRAYTGLVPSFLGSIGAGALPKLTSLWVDEWVLVPQHGTVPDWEYDEPSRFTVQSLLGPESGEEMNILWTRSLRAAFGQLESLRVGFGPITHTDAGLILDLCDPAKLTQFGFEWKWQDYARDAALSPELLAHLARFPKLADIHILFPRPETQLSGRPEPVIDSTTLHDVASIFACNGHVARVGIGNSVVWERCGPSGFVLVSDGSTAPNVAVPRFFHAGYMAKYFLDVDATEPDSENVTPPRPVRSEEIEQLRDVLQRVVG
ncbi:hypothetical protein B0H15DRAFT_949539 [Mycena belliarum]|uniref:Uncharacterized protein n=1 Tax=Mycena belliarum TaxID=1033014 RepID=A0AAD6XNY9_9AGAR|nr:hypothetical protein B0H15DRAFT_949539 [Mycena belliae]